MPDYDTQCAGFRRDAVAIVGMACRFPGADSPQAFWENLRNGVESVTRWPAAASGGNDAIVARALLAGVEQFDANFFHFTPRQAQIADPQLRIALECAWEAVEHAGYDLDRYEGLVGVFMGASLSTYLLRNVIPNLDALRASASGAQILFLNDKDFIPTRISHRLNLKGPSLNISTACSTSLVAVHAACQALATYQCDMALAGASSVLLPQEQQGYEPGGIYAEDGHCRAFDERANGTVGGSGCGLVVLKRIEEALRDGDFIHAVILGGATNNDGADKASFAAPSVTGQRGVIEQALANAGVDAASITLVEGHGTGTLLGDALELQALDQVFQHAAIAQRRCALGSVKTNLGHLDTAAGIAGLMKVSLALRHTVIPPSLHFERPNPQSRLEAGALYVPKTATQWSEEASPRRAGVSAFGIGGTNAHLVLEEAPARPASAATRPWYVVPLSAMSQNSLAANANNLLHFLREAPEGSLADVAFTLGTGRKAFEFRRAYVCRDRHDLIEQLGADSRDSAEHLAAAPRTPVAFVLSRVENWSPAVLAAAYEHEPEFRQAITECSELAAALLGQRATQFEETLAGERLPQDPQLRRAIVFCATYALARLWMSWGVQPNAVAGEDEGTWVAARLAGMYSLADALRLALGMATIDQVRRAAPQIRLLTPGNDGLRDDEQYFALEFGGRWQAAGVSSWAGRTSAWRGADTSAGGLKTLLASFANAWVMGLAVDWRAMFANESRLRLPLPTYAFERSRYWLDPPEPAMQQAASPSADQATSSTVAAVAAGEDVVADWFYVPTWKRDVRILRQSAGEPKNWLLLSVPGKFCACLTEHLRRGGHHVVEAFAANHIEWLDEQRLQMNPAEPGDYDALFAKLAASGRTPERIVHLWCLTEDVVAGCVSQLLDRGLVTGLHSLLFMAQALGRTNVTTGIRITSLYNGVHDIAGGLAMQPHKAALTAALKIIPLEYPNLSCQGLEISLPAAGTIAEERLTKCLIDEADSEPADAFAAYRDDARWVPTFEPVRLPSPTSERPRLKNGGVYLITGGGGGVGLEIAEYLSRNVRCSVALLGRTRLPPAERWEALAAASAGDTREAHVARKLRQLRENGCSVMSCQADIADRAAVTRAIAEIEERFGRIDGVIHAAGEPDTFGVIQNRTRAMTERVLSAKVRGAVLLDELLRGRSLDFFVLCSTIGSVLHALKSGEVGYVAANDFLDAFASYRRARERGLTVAINWTDWQDVGMSARAMKRYERKPEDTQKAEGTTPSHPLLGSRVADGAPDTVTFRSTLQPEKHWVLDGHRISGVPVLPGTAYLELAFAAFAEYTGARTAQLRDVSLIAPLIIPDGEVRELRVTLAGEREDLAFRIESSGTNSPAWNLHASGHVGALAEDSDRDRQRLAARRELSADARTFNPQDLAAADAGMQFGGRWRSIRKVTVAHGHGSADLDLPAQYHGDLQSYFLHPALLDCAVSFLIPALLESRAEPYVPLHYRSVRIRMRGQLPSKLFAHAHSEQPRVQAGGTLTLDAQLLDETGAVWVDVSGMTARKNNLSAPPASMPEGAESAAANYILDMGTVGQLSTLRFFPRALPAPGPDEVEVEVAAAALNFKDVLIALGMVRSPPKGKFGLECAGTVVRVGANVRDLSVGDDVMGFGGLWVAPRAVVPASWVARRPGGLSPQQAASSAIAFSVAQLALRETGRLRSGESVLIHSATGGVGLAAIQIAREAGAQIHATAGSEAKRDFLRRIGIEHVHDSRSPAFAREILQLTGGKGVDVILNSLGPELSRISLDVLKPQGRFLELGLVNEALESIAQAERKYFLPITVNSDDPGLERAWAETVKHLSDGTWSALPTKTFAVGELAAAFDYMAAARHIGKIVISYADWPQYARSLSVASPGETAAVRLSQEEYFKQLLRSMPVSDALDAFDRILNQEYSRVVISVEQLQPLIERSNAARKLGIHSFLADQNLAVARRTRPDLGTPLQVAQNDTQARLVKIWKDLLGLGDVGIDDNFFDLGGDSLIAIRLLSRCREEFQVDQTLAGLLDHPTIVELAQRIEQLRAPLKRSHRDSAAGNAAPREHMVL